MGAIGSPKQTKALKNFKPYLATFLSFILSCCKSSFGMDLHKNTNTVHRHGHIQITLKATAWTEWKKFQRFPEKLGGSRSSLGTLVKGNSLNARRERRSRHNTSETPIYVLFDWSESYCSIHALYFWPNLSARKKIAALFHTADSVNILDLQRDH